MITRTRCAHRIGARIGALAIAAAAAFVQLPTTPAGADSSTTLTVVGTSDVFDSNLIQAVIKPGFEHAYPGITLNYVSKGTGAAIQYAEAGTASALLVHAASLENQFVASGYSLEQYGRAIFYGDYVLLGPASDPAGVLTAAPHDIVTAFEKIAATGAQGHANFVSRGGTPGTTVEEHLLWSLTQGQTLCTVSAANGGGQSPSTTTGACPSSISYPSWYHATGLTQGPNVVNGDVCSYSGGGCYVLTDRGTYNYLVSTNAVSTLKIVTRDNGASARGGSTALINSFHAYGINPAKFSGDAAAQINTTAARDFLTWITSPAAQTAVSAFLAAGGDPPFLADAAPALRATSKIPATVKAGAEVAIAGTLTNLVPGTPALVGQKVQLVSRAAARARGADLGAARVVATATTDAQGRWTFAFVPATTATYSVTSGAITQVEDGTLNPIFADLLQPSTATLGSIRLLAHPTVGSITVNGRKASFVVQLAPASLSGYPAHVRVFLGRKSHGLKLVKTVTVKPGARTVKVALTFPGAGDWSLRAAYVSTAQFSGGTTVTETVRVL